MDYDVTISCEITKADGSVFYKGTNFFGGVDPDAAAFFAKAGNDLHLHAKANSGQAGKVYTVVAGTRVVGTDGSVLADGAPQTYAGVSYDAIIKAEEKLMQLGFDLGTRGKALRDGKHKHDRDQKHK